MDEIALHKSDILYLATVFGKSLYTFYFQPSVLAQMEVFLFLVDTQETTSQQVGGDARRTASRKGVEHPRTRAC